MAEDVDVAFLLTTNRADLLEPALAARPGRVDQAVEIPLPDTAARRELFALYSRGLTLADDIDLDAVAEGTAGATASLLKELARRATLYALDETGTPPPQPAGQPGPGVSVSRRHVTAALDELTRGASDLTRRLLGRPDDEPVIETVEPMLGDWTGDLPSRARPGRGRMPPGPGLVGRY